MWSYQQCPTPEDILHFGVLGMKWGVRKASKTSSDTSSAQKPTGPVKPFKLSRPNDKPHFTWTEQERANFDAEFGRKRAAISKRYRENMSPEQKHKLMLEAGDLENEYLDVVERDW